MILLTLDSSEESETALRVAADLANRFGEPLRLLLVLDGPLRAHYDKIAKGEGTTVDETAERYVEGAIARAKELTPEVEGRFEHAVDAGRAIVEAAEDEDVVLVVMATHGRSGLSRLLVGSVTDHVIRHSTVPVVAVPVKDQS